MEKGVNLLIQPPVNTDWAGLLCSNRMSFPRRGKFPSVNGYNQVETVWLLVGDAYRRHFLWVEGWTRRIGKLWTAGGQIQADICFCKVLLEHTTPLIYVLSMAAFYYSVELGSVTETTWPAKPKVFNVWPFREEVCWLLDEISALQPKLFCELITFLNSLAWGFQVKREEGEIWSEMVIVLLATARNEDWKTVE